MSSRHVHRSDQELVQQCLDGRQESWNELVERYERLVYSIPRRCGLEEADCQDVFQNVFIQLFRRLETLRDSQRLAAWLLTTAHRESWRVGRRRRSWSDLEETLGDPGGPGEDELARAETQQLVQQALRRLGGRDARLLEALFRTPGPPNYQNIASELGMKPGSIGPTRARAFRKLEKILVELGLGGEEGAEDQSRHEGTQARRHEG
jgi:RNA polymerase sigma factor (sigma-70 family)